MARSGRGIPEINAGSMADIAFLLLVFFLVTTTMDIPTGLQVTLPPITDVPPPDTKQRKRNVLEVLVNANDQLLVEGELMRIEKLKDKTIQHLTNEGKDPNLAVSSTDAIVSLKNDRGTSYDMYVRVYNELSAAYSEVRDEYSIRKFGVPLDKLRSEDQAKEVTDKYPKKLSEAEPVNVGGN
ncbi:biopolymer transporter ExbD [bacterium]|nr:biopolymer transporter ExbD [bacterium]